MQMDRVLLICSVIHRCVGSPPLPTVNVGVQVTSVRSRCQCFWDTQKQSCWICVVSEHTPSSHSGSCVLHSRQWGWGSGTSTSRQHLLFCLLTAADLVCGHWACCDGADLCFLSDWAPYVSSMCLSAICEGLFISFPWFWITLVGVQVLYTGYSIYI